MCRILACPIWFDPLVTPAKVLPAVIANCNLVLSINEEQNSIIPRIVQVFFKVFVGLVSGSTSNDLWSHTIGNDFLKVFAECYAARSYGSLLVTAAFNIDLRAHQRVPPISPFRQRSPSEYSFSHFDSSLICSRRKMVAPSRFSQTITDSAVSVNSSTNSSE